MKMKMKMIKVRMTDDYLDFLNGLITNNIPIDLDNDDLPF